MTCFRWPATSLILLLVMFIAAPAYARHAHRSPAEAPSLAPGPTPSPNAPRTAAPTTDDVVDLSIDQQGAVNLTLADSVKLAIRAATSVLKSENDTHFTGAQLLQAYGQFLPNLTGGANYDYHSGNTYYAQSTPTQVSGRGTDAGWIVQTDLNLFNGLSDFSGLKSSLLKQDASQLTLLRARQQISLDVTQSYLQVVLDARLVNIARKNLQESREREKLLQEQTRLGARNLSDLFRQQAQASQDEASLIQAENKLRTDQIQFLRKLRIDVAKNYHFTEPAVPEDLTGKTLESEDQLIARALEKRADLKASNDTADATHWDVHAAQSGYLPKLDLIGNASSGAHYLDAQAVNGANVLGAPQPGLLPQLGNQVDYTVGLYLTWNIFDRFVTHENAERAQVAADDAAIDAEDSLNQVKGDVRQAYGSYITSVQQLHASKKGLDAARKAYQVMEGRYEVGGASFLDLITSQAALTQAESTRAQAMIDFQLQDQALEFALGETVVE